jgi:hypothetical protein
MSLCKYKNIFGEPNTGAHSYRVYDVAIVDVIFTIIGAYIVAKYMNVSFIITMIIAFALGIILHRLFCVRTTVDKILF